MEYLKRDVQLSYLSFYSENLNRNKALTDIVSNAVGICRSYTDLDDSFYESRKLINGYSKSLGKLYDTLYHLIMSNLDKSHHELRDLILKRLKNQEIDTLNYYTVKYCVDSIIATNCLDSSVYDFEEKEIMCYLVIYGFNCLIDVIIFKTDKRQITGVDLATNKAKYTTALKYYDRMNKTYKTESELRDMEFLASRLVSTYGSASAISVDTKDIMDINDKIDDSFRMIQDEAILIDVLNQMNPEVTLCKPITKEIRHSVETGNGTSFRSEKFLNRKFMTGAKGNLLLINKFAVDIFNVKSVLVRDVLINDFLACLAVSYITADGDENSMIMPLNFNAVRARDNSGLLVILENFYGIRSEGDYGKQVSEMKLFEVMSPYYWKYRYKGYTTDKEKVSTIRGYKEYREVPIGIHKAKMGNPSNSAIKLAELHHIVLEAGETLVDEHVRHYGTKEGVCD